MSERAEQLFGKYRLRHRMAMGGMAEIFRAELLGAAGFSREVVIKRIHPEFSEEDEFVRMFTNEAKWAALLRHPNIVQVLDFDQVDGTFYIAMELVEGADLKKLQSRGRKGGVALPFQLALYIVIQALKGLGHAHQYEQDGQPLHIVHRDVSPHNILISSQGEVKVTDFGIARVMQQNAVTKSGVLKGKASYMAPEQTYSSKVDHRADLFSVGVVLWELLCRKRLFAASNDLLALHNVREGEITPPHEIDANVPLELSSCVMSALSRPLEDRVSDALTFARQLQAFLWLPSAAEELSAYSKQALLGDGIDPSFQALNEFRAPIQSLSRESFTGLATNGTSRSATKPLTSFEEDAKGDAKGPKRRTKKLDSWELESAVGGVDAKEDPALAKTEAAPTPPANHDWMIKTEAFGAATAGVVVDDSPVEKSGTMSVVSTVQVDPSGVLAKVSEVSAIRAAPAAETVQLDPSAHLTPSQRAEAGLFGGLDDDDPLAKTQLDPEEPSNIAAQMAALAAAGGLSALEAADAARDTDAIPLAETVALSPAQHLPVEVLSNGGTSDANAEVSAAKAGQGNPMLGWLVLGVSVLFVCALLSWVFWFRNP